MWKFSFLAVIWSLWKERNLRCFKGRSYHWQALVDRAKFSMASWVLLLPLLRGFSLDLVMFK